MRRLIILFFAAATGYISLSQEMLWMRAVSYMTGGDPRVFAHVLGFFLIGVALGSFWAEKLCERLFAGAARSPMPLIGGLLLISGAFYYLSISVTANLLTVPSSIGAVAMYAIVAAVSFLLGGIFPLLCHYGARAGEAAGITV